jgi:hypothetical protein
MTKTLVFDCDKWYTVIAIVLWSGATLGFCVLSYFSYIWFDEGTPINCISNTWRDGMTGNYVTVCHTKTSGDRMWDIVDLQHAQGLLVVMGSLPTGINFFFIWKVINAHTKWIAVRCKADVVQELERKYRNKTMPKGWSPMT